MAKKSPPYCFVRTVFATCTKLQYKSFPRVILICIGGTVRRTRHDTGKLSCTAFTPSTQKEFESAYKKKANSLFTDQCSDLLHQARRRNLGWQLQQMWFFSFSGWSLSSHFSRGFGNYFALSNLVIFENVSIILSVNNSWLLKIKSKEDVKQVYIPHDCLIRLFHSEMLRNEERTNIVAS